MVYCAVVGCTSSNDKKKTFRLTAVTLAFQLVKTFADNDFSDNDLCDKEKLLCLSKNKR